MFLHDRNKAVRNSKKRSFNQRRELFNNGYMVISVLLLSLPICTFGILSLKLIGFNSSLSTNYLETSYHPTSIPWIENSRKCEDSGRIWEANKCWDTEHSPLF